MTDLDRDLNLKSDLIAAHHGLLILYGKKWFDEADRQTAKQEYIQLLKELLGDAQR